MVRPFLVETPPERQETILASRGPSRIFGCELGNVFAIGPGRCGHLVAQTCFSSLRLFSEGGGFKPQSYRTTLRYQLPCCY